MRYRKFKDAEVSLLGFGTMRLPVTDDKVNREEAIRMIRRGIDRGINYVDTAYMYHDGESETVVGEALKDGYREKIFLADKMPVWLAKDKAEVENIFNKQLERLEVDCIDMYLIHNITAPIWNRCKEFDVLRFLEEKRAEGKIRYIGFSFHDELPLFKEVVDSYPWDFCQIQLNYMDMEYQAGVEGLKYAADKGLPVIIMEPLKGGKLTDIVPSSVKEYWDKAAIKRTPASWALRWVANFPEVKVILSGVHSMEQLEENMDILSDAEANSLKDSELDIISKVGNEYNRLIPYSCTECRYCLPCPQKIDIPTNIKFRNEWDLYGNSPKTMSEFNMWIAPKRRPSTCIKCGECEGKCPQHLPIINIMNESAKIFE